jgi:hypothetical protein
MKHKKTIFGIIYLLFFISLMGCSPKISSQLFYDYRKSNDQYFEFKDNWYSVKITDSEIDSIPQSVRRYLKKSGIAGRDRFEELFYEYGGSVKLKGFTKIGIAKHYRMSEHTSTMEPRFSAIGKSFPIKASLDLIEEGLINANMIGLDLPEYKNYIGEEVDDILTLKYIALMVWYPSAFLNKKIQWEPVISNGVIDSQSIWFSIQDKNLRASGTLHFDPKTDMPLSFTGTITNAINSHFEVEDIQINFSQFRKNDGTYVPEKCTATIGCNEDQKIIAVFKLDKIKQPDFNNYFKEKEKNRKTEAQRDYFI